MTALTILRDKAWARRFSRKCGGDLGITHVGARFRMPLRIWTPTKVPQKQWQVTVPAPLESRSTVGQGGEFLATGTGLNPSTDRCANMRSGVVPEGLPRRMSVTGNSPRESVRAAPAGQAGAPPPRQPQP